MSHFSQIKTKLRNLSSLQSALTDLGTEWKAGPCPVRGYQGQTQQPLTVDGFLRQVTQRYAYNTVLAESSRQGFQLAEEQVQQDGSVRLVVQRWNG
jgi:Cft2 family RNA processing exonuclease